ncbi:MAG: hypothetical protein QNJ54_28655 [Prochloraceae cyanobacterium]|nr:hypothetical protein [Prochloraceae cyanobacterium]
MFLRKTLDLKYAKKYKQNKKLYIKKNEEETFKALKTEKWEDFAKMCDISTPKGVVKFKPYEYQKELIAQIEEHTTTVICKTRQLGVTETILNYFLWKAIKSEGYKAAVFSKGQEDTSEFSFRIRFSVTTLNLPIDANSTRKLRIEGGGSIYYRNSKIHNARSLGGVSDLLYDENAFVDDIEGIFKASAPCITTAENPKIIILSTPNGQNNWFYDRLIDGNPDRDIMEVCRQIREGKTKPIQYWTDYNGKCKFFLHWKAHPEFSQKENYLEELQKTTGMSKSAIEQEYNLNFGESDSIVFRTDLINKIFNGDYHLIFEPDKYTYYAGLDVATTGEDYLVFAIVAESKVNGKFSLAEMYRSDEGTFKEHLERIEELLQKYYPLCVAIEITGGEGAIYRETLEENLPQYNYYSFKTSSATKQAAIDRLIYYFEKESITLPDDPEIKQEFLDFKRKDKKLTAKSGSHDDTIMAIAIALDGVVYFENL